MDTITLRHIPGSCCPEKDCSVGSWDGKHCRSCGADCSKCPLNGLVEKEKTNHGRGVKDNGTSQPWKAD